MTTHETEKDTLSSNGPDGDSVSVTPTSLCTALAVATLLVSISDAVSSWANLTGGRYMILTILTLAIATMVPKLRVWCTGGFELGVVLSFVFFASIAAGADVVAMLSVAPILITFGEHFADNPLTVPARHRALAEADTARIADRI